MEATREGRLFVAWLKKNQPGDGGDSSYVQMASSGRRPDNEAEEDTEVRLTGIDMSNIVSGGRKKRKTTRQREEEEEEEEERREKEARDKLLKEEKKKKKRKKKEVSECFFEDAQARHVPKTTPLVTFVVELTMPLNFTPIARLLLSRHLALRARCRRRKTRSRADGAGEDDRRR